MAEGWARYIYGDRVVVCSAGTAPHRIDPGAVKVMAEVGVDIFRQTSNHLDEFLDLPFDLVVTVCDKARESCPVFPGGVKTMHRSFDDPPYLARDAVNEDEALGHYRRVRDEIKDMVENLRSQISDLK
jgi:arsenate reductase